MPTAVKEETFELNRNVTGMAETDIAVSTGEGLQNIWRYQVPTGYSLVFDSKDHFAAYLENASAAEVAAGSLVDIVIEDAAQQARRPLLNTIRYSQARGSATTFLAFQDENYFNYLDIPAGEVVMAREGEWVLIRGNVNTTLDASDSYFLLTCKRVRHTLFE